MSKNARIRRGSKDADNPYKAMRRSVFEDESISWESRGLMGYILVKPDDWDVSPQDLVNSGTAGRDKIYRMLRELRAHRYIALVKETWADGPHRGQVIGYFYDVWEARYTDEDYLEPLPEKPYTAEPDAENPHNTKKEVIPIKKSTNQEGEQKKKTSSVVSSSVDDQTVGEDENLSHSKKKPQNRTPADRAKQGQNNTLAELTPQPDPTAQLSYQVLNTSHSDKKLPNSTMAGLASLAQNNPLKNQAGVRDGMGPNQEPTVPQEDGASFSLCEGSDLEQVIAMFEHHVGDVTKARRNRLAGWLDEYEPDLLIECIKATGDYEPKTPLRYLGVTLRDRQERLERLAAHQEMLMAIPPVAAEPVDQLTQLKELAVIKGATHMMATNNLHEWALYAMSHHDPPLVLVGYAYANGSVPKPHEVAMNRELGLDRIPEEAMAVGT